MGAISLDENEWTIIHYLLGGCLIDWMINTCYQSWKFKMQ